MKRSKRKKQKYYKNTVVRIIPVKGKTKKRRVTIIKAGGGNRIARTDVSTTHIHN